MTFDQNSDLCSVFCIRGSELYFMTFVLHSAFVLSCEFINFVLNSDLCSEAGWLTSRDEDVTGGYLIGSTHSSSI